MATATTPDRTIRNNLNDNDEDNAELRPPCVRKLRREQQRVAQATRAIRQSYGREDSEEEQARVARIAQFAHRYSEGLEEIEDDNDEDEVVNH